MRDRNETQEGKRNRQVPEQTRIQRILHLNQRADKDGYAQEPGDAANRRCKPGQMNQTPTRLCQLVQRRCLTADISLKPMKQVSKRKNSFQPKINTDGVNENVVNDDRAKETLSQRRSKHRFYDRCVVPNIEGAPENLGDHRRQHGEQEPVTRAKCASFNFGGHNVDVILIFIQFLARNLKSQVPKPQANLKVSTSESYETTDNADGTDDEEVMF